MLQEDIMENVARLPEFYQKEILNFSKLLLNQIQEKIHIENNSRGGFGARKGDYIMSPDFDEPFDDFLEYMQ